MSTPDERSTHVMRFSSAFTPGTVLRGSSFDYTEKSVTIEFDAMDATISQVCEEFCTFLRAAGWVLAPGTIVYDRDAAEPCVQCPKGAA